MNIPTFFRHGLFGLLIGAWFVFTISAHAQSNDPSLTINSQARRHFVARLWENCSILPDESLYPAYLADTQASRMAAVWSSDEHLGWILDATLGAQLPLLQKHRGSRKTGMRSEGFQLAVEGAAHLRLDGENSFELYSTDYRFGIPFSWGNQRWQFKTGFYHSSSHAGDEFIIRQVKAREMILPGGAYRYMYSRDSWLLGLSYRPHPDLRLYGELDYDFIDGTDEGGATSLHVLFGAEYSAPYRPERRISPFAALNVRFYEEKDFNGSLCIQCGLQYRKPNNHLLRIGVQYYYGVGEQYQTLYSWWKPENKIGLGVWYDF